jgi:ubiquinone/menaquinone biosynthesis C-methylase UbiE
MWYHCGVSVTGATLVDASDKLFAGSIPEIYDRYLVPLIFEPYAVNVAARINKIAPSHVLETAAGTGVLTRALAARLPQGARIVATDLNQPMLDYAKARHSGAGRERIEWKQADAQALPFPDQSFDAVACQFGVMFFPDKVQGYKEARRVLKPGGQFIFTVWDKISENDFADTVTQALASVFPDDPPRFLARTPHGYHDETQIRSDLKNAGFANVSVDDVSATSKAASALDPAIGFCQGTPLRNELEARDPARLEDATKQAAIAVADRYGSGAIEGRIRALVISAAR